MGRWVGGDIFAVLRYVLRCLFCGKTSSLRGRKTLEDFFGRDYMPIEILKFCKLLVSRYSIIYRCNTFCCRVFVLLSLQELLVNTLVDLKRPIQRK